jgi:hypothetical protein
MIRRRKNEREMELTGGKTSEPIPTDFGSQVNENHYFSI